MLNLLIRSVVGLAIVLIANGLSLGQVIIENSPIYSAPVYEMPSPIYGTPVYGTPVYGTPVYGTPVYGTPVYGTPVHGTPAPSTSHTHHSHTHHSGCNHPHDPCNWSSGSDCKCKCKVCLSCYHIHMSNHCKKVDCETKDLDYKPIGRIPTIDDKKHCYVKHWDFTADVEVPYIVCKEETCFEIDKRRFSCLPGCEFSLCVPVKECTEKEITCELRKKNMDIRVYRREQDGGVSYDVYVLNADSGPKHAGGMPKRWVIFHCATISQIKAELPNITLAAHSTRQGTKVSQDDQSHPNPDAAKRIEISYSIEQFKKSKMESRLETSPSVVEKSQPKLDVKPTRQVGKTKTNQTNEPTEVLASVG